MSQTDFLTLTPRDWEAFVTALDHLDRPRPKLTAAMKRYHAWRSEHMESPKCPTKTSPCERSKSGSVST